LPPCDPGMRTFLKKEERLRTFPLAAMALLAFATAPLAHSATPPKPGRYSANISVAEVEGAECPDPLGAQYQGVARYRGLNGSRLTIRIPIVFDGVPVFDRQVLTITAGKGSLSPSGDFSARITAPIDLTVSGTFDATLTLSDAESFGATVVETAPEIACTEKFVISLVRTGR
jgi:hypothetical protein